MVLLILFAWLFLPVIELVIIVVLAVVNKGKNEQIKRLEMQLGIRQQTDSVYSAEEKSEDLMEKSPVSAEKSEWEAKPGFSRGTAALVAGVVLVVLAGLIFGTTTWHILPDICKAAFVFGFAVLFFAASFLAQRLLKIRRTGCAFYILGSIFLMLSVLAVGYFQLLGVEFVMMGYYQWRVLCVGSFLTTAALFGGCRNFRDRVYTCCCLWGLTISVLFLLLSFRLQYSGVAYGMMYYGTAWIALRLVWIPRCKKEEESGEDSGHIENCGDREQANWRVRDNLETFVPMHFGAAAILLAPLLLGNFIVRLFFQGEGIITLQSVVAVACLVTGMGMLAWNREKKSLKILYQLCCVIFFYYVGLWLPVNHAYRLCAGTILSGGYFLVSRKFGWETKKLHCVQGDAIYTAAIIINGIWMLIRVLVDLAFLHSQSVGRNMSVHVSASIIMVMLTIMVVWWGQKYPKIRTLIPVALSPLIFTLPVLANGLLGTNLKFYMALWVYLVIMMVWDIKQKDKFWPALSVLGAFCQAAYLGSEGKQVVFLVLLTGYYFCKIWQIQKDRTLLIRAMFAYFLESAFILSVGLMPDRVISMLPVLVLLIVEYAVSQYAAQSGKIDLLHREDWFWDVSGVLLFVIAVQEFLWTKGCSLWNLAALLLIFTALYKKFYRGNGLWQHLILTLSIIPLPFVVAARYGIGENLWLGGVMGIVLLSGISMRRYTDIMEWSDDGERLLHVDWYHILIVLILVPMMLLADKNWRVAYLVLLALYALQYAALPKLRSCAVTVAEILLIFAWWAQPFFKLPNVLWLEIQILPVFFFIYRLPVVWGETDETHICQRVLNTMLLVVLAGGALIRGRLINALILEGICLVVFISSHVRKSVWWVRTSGIVMVTAAIYMTRGFWMSISWWVYLLTAGLVLIGFAAWNEIRKRGKE